eukprot:XP_017948626.1 PREDICTED: mucin-2 [Xenopus tropicalis]
MGHQMWVLALMLSLSNAYDIIPGRPIDHTNSICSSWGNFHYKTFDGVIYQFPGTCNYNLATDCGNSYHDFSIHIQRAIENGSPVIHQINMQIKDVTIELKRDSEKLNGIGFETPYFSYGIFINKKDGYTMVNTKTGLTLTWNQEDSVMLELDSKYNGKICGLCGDFNGMPVSNEFYMNDMPLNPIQFGNMQNINDPTVTCTNVDESQQMNASSCGQYYSVCKSYLSQSAFSSCQDLLEVSDYVMACMLDVCSCSSADVSCLCSTLTEFSRQCTHAGGSPQNWRTDTLCPKQCPGNMIYKESGSPCISSCSHREVKSLCEEHDVDGCFCPDGTVWDDYNNTGCISTTQCSCKFRDQLYAPGSNIINDCDECYCNEGKWVCAGGTCPKVCSIEGGAHFQTFDGKLYDFFGRCYYLLSKIDLRSNDSYTIAAELTPCNAYSRETCLKTIKFYTDNGKNILSIRADGSVLLNDLQVSIPHITGSFSVIQPSESFVVVETEFGLQIQIQFLPLMQVYITMDNSEENAVEGLCGNFNYIEGDDFTTSGGIDESTASAFANTWKMQSTCQDSVEMLGDPCSFSVETKTYAEFWCSKVKDSDSIFGTCHDTVDPNEYYKRCMSDTCSCSRSDICMCAAMSSYARACAAKGKILWGWRNGTCENDIPSCPATQTYLYNITTCQPTCRSLALGEKDCDSEFTPIDGCGCPDGTYVNEKGGCVPISECSCYYQGMYLRPYEVFYKRDERCLLAACSNGKVFFDCSSLQKGDPIPQHRSCRTLNIGPVWPECISGCVCPEGLLDDGTGGCVLESYCPCTYNNEVFPHGSSLNEECKSCACESGIWSCIQTPCYGTCTIFGSGHYITFDKKFYDFDGSCEFVVAQDYCGDVNGTFRIITENIPCGTTGVTCSKSIKIYLGNSELKLANEHLEQTVVDPLSVEEQYRAREVGLYIVIHTKDDIFFIWDKKTSILIRLPSSYKGNVCGLCGNYDDNANNDFLTSQLIQASNVMDFGNSWKRSNLCPDANSIPQPCFSAPHRRSWAEKKCDIINSNVFLSCHSRVNPKPFYDSCVNDVCSCDTGGDCECFCTALAAYAQQCSKVEVCIDWRTPEICPIYCDYYNDDANECMWHYMSCGPQYSTFQHITKYCFSPPVTHLEGCYPVCPPERPYYDERNKSCVDACDSCFINNRIYMINDTVPSNDICQTCKCDINRQLSCSPIPNPPAKCISTCSINGQTYNINDVVPTSDDCSTCKCDTNRQLSCTPLQNPPAKCTTTCSINGQTYNINDVVPTTDVCSTCKCDTNQQMTCTPVENPPAKCIYKCIINGQTYSINDVVPSTDDCSTCKCNTNQQVSCSPLQNPPAKCITTCSINGQTYNINDIVPTTDDCSTCMCDSNQQLSCSLIQNPPAKCIYKCYVNGQTYNINDVVPTTDACSTCKCDTNRQLSCTPLQNPPAKCITTCSINGQTYNINDVVPTTDDCYTCKCDTTRQLSCTPLQNPPAKCTTTCSINGQTYNINDVVPTTDDCYTCKCDTNQQVTCTPIANPPAKCITTCSINGQTYNINDVVPTSDDCSTCKCDTNQQVSCSLIQNPPAKCTSKCYINGLTYNINDVVPTSDDCSTCKCDTNRQLSCTPLQNPPAKCTTTCSINGQTYNINDVVPTTNDCYTCKCDSTQQLSCTPIANPPAKCTSTCYINGQTYNINDVVPSADDCSTCKCDTNRQLSCTPLQNPPAKCTTTCSINGQTYNINDVVPTTNDCYTCKCDSTQQLSCTPIENPPAKCTSTCYINGQTYNINDVVPSADDCSTCICDTTRQLSCTPLQNPPAKCTTTCSINGQTYNINDVVPSTDDCYTCKCDSTQQLTCTPIANPPAKCTSTCYINGQTYNINDVVPSTDDCSTCTCDSTQQLTCTPIQNAKCTSNCYINGQTYNINDVVPSADDCSTW